MTLDAVGAFVIDPATVIGAADMVGHGIAGVIDVVVASGTDASGRAASPVVKGARAGPGREDDRSGGDFGGGGDFDRLADVRQVRAAMGIVALDAEGVEGRLDAG